MNDLHRLVRSVRLDAADPRQTFRHRIGIGVAVAVLILVLSLLR